MRCPPDLRRNEAGISLIELMIATLVMSTIVAMAVVQVGAARPAMLGDAAMRSVMLQLAAARETAVAQRRNVEMRFAGTNAVQLFRQNLPTGTTLLRSFTFEGGVVYHVNPPVVDTPDGFGVSAAINFGTATKVIFNSDGMLVDQAGSPVNGTIFIALPDHPQSARAVTVLGSTGRVRGFRWTGTRWTQI